jgi:hypothetical protein
MSQKERGQAATTGSGSDLADDSRNEELSVEFTGGEDHGPAIRGASDVCPHCGQSLKGSLDQFLGRLGVTEEMVRNLKGQFQNVDIDEYLNTAREYLKGTGGKAQVYAKENPGKVAAGVAALVLGAGLIWSREKRAGTQELEDRFRQLELKRALAGRKYRLEEVLGELGVTT